MIIVAQTCHHDKTLIQELSRVLEESSRHPFFSFHIYEIGRNILSIIENRITEIFVIFVVIETQPGRVHLAGIRPEDRLVDVVHEQTLLPGVIHFRPIIRILRVIGIVHQNRHTRVLVLGHQVT